MILNIKGQKTEIEGASISEGAKNYATFEIKCDKSWRKLSKTIRFKHSDSDEIYDLAEVKEKEVLYIPHEVLKRGKVEVSVIGVKGDCTVATTSIAEFEVMSSLDGGKTPTVSKDAYAQYADSVISARKSCEKAEKTVLQAKKEILKARDDSQAFFVGAKKALEESREILEKVSGAIDAMGLVLRDIKKEENKLIDFDSKLTLNEEKRNLYEKERIMKESMRDKAEALRQEKEKERELLEAGRISSEKARGMMDIRREEQLKDILERLLLLEENKESYLEEKSCKNYFSAEEKVVKLTLTPEENTQSILTPAINEEKVVIELSAPLKRIGDCADEVVLEKEKSYVLRRITSITLKGDEEITEGESIDDCSLFLIELPNAAKETGYTNHFTYGREKGECMWTVGSYLFLKLKTEIYPTKAHLSHYLKSLEEPLTVTYVLENEIKEHINLSLDEIRSASLEGFTIKATTAKSIISTLTKLLEKKEN